MSIITLDWRRFGDFSAVGQLTEKIFSFEPALDVYPLQCLDDGVSCCLFHRRDTGALHDVFGKKVFHDTAINRIRKLAPRAIYVRLSIHSGTLELACKLAVALPDVPLVLHYMDKPDLAGLSGTRAQYLTEMYRFLAARAHRIYTIHDSSIAWIEQEYGRRAHVLANFVAQETHAQHDLSDWQNRKIRIRYFGSIDRKMNAAALADVCRVVSNLPWVELSIWSNSGVWGDVKDLRDRSDNISISHSNLDGEAFRAKMAGADLLLLPYNLDETSRRFLRHSYSNKFIDYLEAGGIILCLGGAEIPTVQACRESGLSLVFGSVEALSAAFVSRAALEERVSELNLQTYNTKIRQIKTAQQARVRVFFDDLKGLEPAANLRADPAATGAGNAAPDPLEAGKLGFLIRRKFLDQMAGRQSLSASLMGRLLRRKGYQGFDYEI